VAPERIEAGISGAMIDGSAVAWGIATPSKLLHRLTMTWDALNASWNEWVLGYGPETQDRFMRWMGMDRPDWRKMLLTLVTVCILLVTGISLILMLRYRAPRSDRAAKVYARFVRKTGIAPRTGETPLQFAERARAEARLSDESIAAVTASYLDARYGPPDPAALPRLKAAVSAARP
jgi:hypothetical protein